MKPPEISGSATAYTAADGFANAPDPARPWLGPQGQPMRRLELHLTYHCPERCAFCSEAHRMEAYKAFPVTWGRVATTLRRHAERGVNSVHLTGGEPTIHPRFIAVLHLAKKLGMRTSVGTIGTRLSQRSFAEEALPALDEALFSLHGPTAAIHDRLAGRVGSFDTVMAAIRHARTLKPGFGLFINTVVTRHNLEHLPDTIDLAVSVGARLVVVSNTTPEGQAADDYADLTARLEDLARVLPTLPPRVPPAVSLRFFGVPMCLLGPYTTLSNDIHWDPRVTVEWQTAPDAVLFDGIYSWAPDRKRTHPPDCAGCTHRGLCMGVYAEYAQRWPVHGILTPFR